ncbi:hydrogenase nickel incorporation protein HypB [Prauserella cavernicola]|uniref:Hydrogenase nickel incorporation protein HypB n=1 Tax=Prauserella cavernicola TaxID=2800127 RepID=A0A934V5T1_9PSEU|nr:hydrogenase nickel incorporation protein HypB [Prauserella cavernicola]MBK1784948.1 hydrogenase nickel incorporation protein HypB [Prauserella cavernicola]
MCATCGCGTEEHSHSHSHTVTMEQDVLAKNDHLAAHNREWLAERGILAVNVMSSPGAGKTTLLERTVHELGTSLAVVEGDQETRLDADRIRAAGAPVVQLNTGAGCHLDAGMLRRALDELDPAPHSVVFVENVGNLVCPALFDLGEGARVVLMSVTEGAGKPLKYPHMFASTDLVLLNKLDLLPYVDFDVAEFTEDLGKVNHSAEVLGLSATRGDGIPEWLDWLRTHPSMAKTGVLR